MEPIRHAGSNLVYRGPATDVGDLWCQRIKPGQIRVVYELDDAERARIAEGGRIELAMYCEPIPPISMIVLPERMCRPIGEHGWKGQSIDDVPDVLPEGWSG
jgi:hypothetical protein